MTGTDARRLAARVLLEVEDGAWSDEALATALAASDLRDEDRALATRLVYGTIARQRSLDHSIAAYSGRPLARLDPIVLVALRLGLFQMFFLDRVPDHAAVGTSVELVARRAASAKGFVNALLRRAQREGPASLPASPALQRLGIEHSHPDWLVKLWIEELGREEAEALLAADNEAAPTCYRALGNRDAALKALAVGGYEAAEAGRWAASSIVLPGPVQRFDDFAVVQGEASQLVVEMLAPRAGERVLDCCAAPGGKTAAIAAALGRDASVLACDPSKGAAERVGAALSAAGVSRGVEFRACRAEDLDAEAASFDAVLVDAPCSGLGTLRQHPEIRWRRKPADLKNLARRQLSILGAIAGLVKPGGRLVYSTCTIARRENDDVVADFLASHEGFTRVPREELPSGVAALCDEDGTLRSFPHRHGIDGFFAVRLRRREDPAAKGRA